ncbi:MAG: LemA family protein [Bacteroidales bacterium]|nr:LemA family protein [Bacteroidales bacterium]
MSPTVIIIIVAVVLIVLWLISVQRKLVSMEEMCKNAMSQIGVQQASRWDALSALVDLVKSYNEHEYNTLRDVIAARSTINGNSTAAEAQAQEDKLNGAMKQFMLVAEQYPELKANDMYTKTMDSVNVYENQVRMSRMVYNDSVTKLNRTIRQFPDSIAASIFHFSALEYLKEGVGKESMPSMKI